MMNHFFYLILLIVSMLGAGVLEIIVVNEEMLLMLCFTVFVFSTYIFGKETIFDSLDQRSKIIKAELLNFMETQNSLILTNLNMVFGGQEKSFITKALVLNLYLDNVELRCIKLIAFFRFAFIQFLEHFCSTLIARSNVTQFNLKMDTLTLRL